MLLHVYMADPHIMKSVLLSYKYFVCQASFITGGHGCTLNYIIKLLPYCLLSRYCIQLDYFVTGIFKCFFMVPKIPCKILELV